MRSEIEKKFLIKAIDALKRRLIVVSPEFKILAAKTPQGVEKSIEMEGERIPMGRMGMPEEIASGILFLASDESSYITGLELIIDGGKIIV